MPVEPKFTFEIDKEGCWICCGRYIDKDGYPQCKVNKSAMSAARYIFIQVHGEIPDGLHVRHKCGKRGCINPSHLILGTHQENMDDRREHGRNASKLTPKQVAEIKKAIRKTEMTNVQISQKYNVSPSAISGIRSGRTWRHITEPVTTTRRP